MSKITNLLGDQAAFYLEHTCRTIDKSLIHIPSSSTIDDTWISSDRNIRTLTQYSNPVRTRATCKYRVCIYSSCRSRHRTYSRSLICPQSTLL